MPEAPQALGPGSPRRRPRRESGAVSRGAAAALLLGGGVALTLCAMRLVAAAFGWGFSPFAYLGVPGAPGGQALVLALLVTVCVVLLALVLGETRDELWLGTPDGGVLLPASALERLLCDAAGAHPDVVRAEARLRVRGAALSAVLNVDLRPLTDASALGAQLTEATRALLASVSGVPEAHVRVRCRVLAVGHLARRLP